MGFWKLAAGALAAITLAGSLPVAAAPILDRGAHYIFKFSGEPDNAYYGQITGQITVNAGAYQDGFFAEQYASAEDFYRPSVIGRPAALASMNVTINDFYRFDLLSAQRVIEQKNSLPEWQTKVSIVDFEVTGRKGARAFYAFLNYFTDEDFYIRYYDLQLALIGNATGGTVSGSYGHDGDRGFGCDFGEGGRCTFSTNYAVSVPEPASLALLGTGVVGLMAMRRRRKAVWIGSSGSRVFVR